MRNRKEGLLASNKEEYCQMYDEQEEQLSKRKRRYPIPKKIPQDNSDDSDDQLGASAEYHLSPKKRTMTEDEEELTTKLKKMNLDLKNLKNQITAKDIINISPTTKSTGSNRSDRSDDQDYKEFFLNQNIVNYDDLLKIVVIGDTAVGKTSFISRMNNKSNKANKGNSSGSGGINSGSSGNSEYIPTKTFEITKTVINVNNKTLGLELWDTNVSILTSELIKTYYKLSNGFIIVIEYTRMADCSFIKKQLELILSCTSNPSILFIVNENKNSSQSPQYKTINEQVVALADRYGITKLHFDLSIMSIEDNNNALVSFFKEIQLQKNSNKKCKYNSIPKRVRTADYSFDYSNSNNSNSNCKSEVPISTDYDIIVNDTPSHIIKSKLNEMYDELNLGS